MTQRKYIEFTHDDYRFQVITYDESRGRVMRAWYSRGGARWEFGHEVVVPASMTDDAALSFARGFLTRKIDHTTYRKVFA